MQSLVDPNNTLLVWCFVFAIAAFAMWSERTKAGRAISGVAVAIMISTCLSNLNVLPKTAPAYETIWTYLVPVAIPLLLLKADIRQIFRESKSLFVAFMLGTVGTIAGTLIGVLVLPLGENAGQLAGVFSATYIGGSMNFAAVGEAVGIDRSLFTAGVAADNVVGTLYLIFIAALPGIPLITRWIPTARAGTGENRAAGDATTAADPPNLSLLYVCLAIAISLAIAVIADFLAAWLQVPSFSLLFITALTVLLANAFPDRLSRLDGHYEIGMLCMYLFFVSIGAGADILQLLGNAPVVFFFAAIIVTTHVVFLLTCCRMLKIDLAEAIIASNACAAGPAPAAALAAGRHWEDLVTPAVLLGVFGYVIANFIGVAFWAYLS